MKMIRRSSRTALLALPLLAAGFLTPNAHAMHHMKDMKKGAFTLDNLRDAKMLIQTLSEEKTEIAALAAQQAQFRKMGGAENNKVARMWGVWIREHKAGGPMFEKLIKKNGGNPLEAKILKAPVLGESMKMMHATHVDHQAAVMTSQMRYGMTADPMVKRAMHKRATLARKHLKQMHPMHNEMNCPMCASMMKDGKMDMKMDKMDHSMGMGAG